MLLNSWLAFIKHCAPHIVGEGGECRIQLYVFQHLGRSISLRTALTYRKDGRYMDLTGMNIEKIGYLWVGYPLVS